MQSIEGQIELQDVHAWLADEAQEPAVRVCVNE